MTIKLSDAVKQRISSGETELLYRTKQWQSLRLEVLERDHYECQRCCGKNMLGYPTKHTRIETANTVHHIQEVYDRPDLMLDKDNLISLCHHCHDVVHGRVTKNFNKPKPKLTEERW